MSCHSTVLAKAILSWLLIAPAAVAEEGTSVVMTSFTWGYLGKLGLALVGVLFFFMLFAWIMRHQQRFGAGHSGGLNVVASLSLGAREKLLVVQVGEQQVMLGATPTQITKLIELDKNIATEATAGGRSFKSNLEQVLKKKAHPL